MNKQTILVADDEENIRKLLSVVLKEQGYNIVLAADGEEALAKFKTHEINLLLADIKMPKMDGLALLKEVKHIKENVPVILMTAYADVDTAVEAIQHGAFDYLVKPFDLEEIKLLVKKVLQPDQYEISDSEHALLNKFEFLDEEGIVKVLETLSEEVLEKI